MTDENTTASGDAGERPAGDEQSSADMLQEIFESVPWKDAGDVPSIRAAAAREPPEPAPEPAPDQPERPERPEPPDAARRYRANDAVTQRLTTLDKKLEAVAASMREAMVKVMREVRRSAGGALTQRIERLSAELASLSERLEQGEAETAAIPVSLGILREEVERLNVALDALGARLEHERAIAAEIPKSVGRLENEVERLGATVEAAAAGPAPEQGVRDEVTRAIGALESLGGRLDAIARRVEVLEEGPAAIER